MVITGLCFTLVQLVVCRDQLPNLINTDLTELLSSISFQEELKKEFFETTLPARLEKYWALLKSRNEGKGFFFGDKVINSKYVNYNVFNTATVTCRRILS